LDLSNPELLNILDNNLQARRNYQPQVYWGTASLFWTEYQNEYIERYPTLGWGDFVAGGLDVQPIPGNHDTMVQEPHVRVLAEKLRLCMEN
jgi:thioesterase domain-containing protein